MAAKLIGLNALVILLFWADRFLKLFFYKNPAMVYGSDFFWGILSFSYQKNFGIAFGFLVNHQFLLILVALILIFLVKLLVKEYQVKNLLNIFSLTLIIFGALSNITDRLRFGYVIDYIDLKWFTVFNLADIMITAGVLFFGFTIFFDQNDKDLDKKQKIS